jgi:hypothetical protein
MKFLAALLVLLQDDPAQELKALRERVEKAPTKGLETYNEFKPLYAAFASKHAGKEEALAAKLWLLQNVGFMREKGRAEAIKLVDEILAEYPKSKQLAQIVEWPYYFSPKKFESVLESMRDNSPHDEVKGVALVGLARLALRNGSAGKAKCKELLTAAKEKYASIPFKTTTCGRMADALLNVHAPSDLEIGKKAPDIEGPDADGKTIKLSDFKGKVVVLDFWGDW